MRALSRLCLVSVVVCAAAVYLGDCFSSSAQPPPIQAGQVIISELRLRGPAGAEDEFVELYNNTDQPISVQAVDGSNGWTVAISNGQITGPIFTIPNGTFIPARGHLLGANVNGYSLSGYPSGNPSPSPSPSTLPAPTTPDRTWDFDVPDGSGVALFGTTNGTNFTAATRLDAFGSTGSPALYREASGVTSVPTANTEHTFYRDLRGGTPKDTNDNAADFLLVATALSIQTPLLGAPGPENTNSPIQHNADIKAHLLDPTVPSSAPPNRERRPTVEPNAPLGTLLIRRRFSNNTGVSVTRLRFRVVDITTLGNENSCGPAGPCADVRALSSSDGQVGITGGQVVTVRGVRLESDPPEQPAGGGFNSSLSADSINLTQPLAPGASINIEFKLGVVRTGTFRFFVNIEAVTQNSPATGLAGKPRSGGAARRLTALRLEDR